MTRCLCWLSCNAIVALSVPCKDSEQNDNCNAERHHQAVTKHSLSFNNTGQNQLTDHSAIAFVRLIIAVGQMTGITALQLPPCQATDKSNCTAGWTTTQSKKQVTKGHLTARDNARQMPLDLPLCLLHCFTCKGTQRMILGVPVHVKK